jgi:hypothetical protein
VTRLVPAHSGSLKGSRPRTLQDELVVLGGLPQGVLHLPQLGLRLGAGLGLGRCPLRCLQGDLPVVVCSRWRQFVASTELDNTPC